LSIDYSKVSDAWERGDPYEQYVGRWSRLVAPRFLSWLGIPAGKRWLDVGCGTGALCASILDHCLPFSVVGVDPSEGFLEKAKDQLAGRVLFRRGSAVDIPLCDASLRNLPEDQLEPEIEARHFSGIDCRIGRSVLHR